MLLDLALIDILEPLSTGKKGTGVIIQSIQSDLETWNPKLLNFTQQGDNSFIDFKMKFRSEAEVILGLYGSEGEQEKIFKSALSQKTLQSIRVFVDRFLDKI